MVGIISRPGTQEKLEILSADAQYDLACACVRVRTAPTTDGHIRPPYKNGDISGDFLRSFKHVYTIQRGCPVRP